MIVDCSRHSGQSNLQERERYDSVMRDLPRNQSGKGLARHACAICAYERGREDMRKEIAKEVAKWLETFS